MRDATTFDRARRQQTVIGKRNKLRTIDREDAGEDFGFELFCCLPATLETTVLFWPPEGQAEPRKRAASETLLSCEPAAAAMSRFASKDLPPFASCVYRKPDPS
jgi:hypothetical protein